MPASHHPHPTAAHPQWRQWHLSVPGGTLTKKRKKASTPLQLLCDGNRNDWSQEPPGRREEQMNKWTKQAQIYSLHSYPHPWLKALTLGIQGRFFFLFLQQGLKGVKESISISRESLRKPWEIICLFIHSFHFKGIQMLCVHSQK